MKRTIVKFTVLMAAGIGYASMLFTWPTEGNTTFATTSAVEQQFQTRFCYQQYRDQTDVANCLKVAIR
jgi:hypothetical protein